MARLEPSQIYSLLLQGGFAPDEARVMTAIAQAESAGRVDAVGDVALQNGKWGPSVGLFQIRTLRAETGTGGDRDIEHLTNDPAAQVKAALEISGGGGNYRPWSTYTSGSYKKYLNEDLREVPVGGLGAAPAAAAPVDAFAIDRGVTPTTVVDTDRDGLTDRFEELLGTDLRTADSDRDGLSDAYEAGISHTDPLSADTDKDKIPDSQEVASGGFAGRGAIPEAARTAGFGGLDSTDSDRDGLSDGYERRLGSDPFATDSDRDGLLDGTEVAQGLNPASLDSDADGLTDAFVPGAPPTLPAAGQDDDLPDLPGS